MTAAEHVPDRPDLPGAERAVAAAGALARHGRERAAMLCSLTDEQLEALLEFVNEKVVGVSDIDGPF